MVASTVTKHSTGENLGAFRQIWSVICFLIPTCRKSLASLRSGNKNIEQITLTLKHDKLTLSTRESVEY